MKKTYLILLAITIILVVSCSKETTQDQANIPVAEPPACTL